MCKLEEKISPERARGLWAEALGSAAQQERDMAAVKCEKCGGETRVQAYFYKSGGIVYCQKCRNVQKVHYKAKEGE